MYCVLCLWAYMYLNKVLLLLLLLLFLFFVFSFYRQALMQTTDTFFEIITAESEPRLFGHSLVTVCCTKMNVS